MWDWYIKITSECSLVIRYQLRNIKMRRGYKNGTLTYDAMQRSKYSSLPEWQYYSLPATNL